MRALLECVYIHFFGVTRARVTLKKFAFYLYNPYENAIAARRGFMGAAAVRVRDRSWCIGGDRRRRREAIIKMANGKCAAACMIFARAFSRENARGGAGE